jgi:hypothetical protein
MSDEPKIEPTVNARGFHGYTELTDSYGASVRVQESSAASAPHVWIFLEGGAVKENNGSAHLNIEQATKVRDALTYWLEEIPSRWDQGAEAEEPR